MVGHRGDAALRKLTPCGFAIAPPAARDFRDTSLFHLCAVGLQTIGLATVVGTVTAIAWYVAAKQRHAKWNVVARVSIFA